MDVKYVNMKVDPDFMNILLKAQEESKRLGVNVVSDILILKNLVYNSESYLSDFFMYSGIQWNKLKTAIEKEITDWLKEAKKNPNEPVNFEEINEENAQEYVKNNAIFDAGVTQIIEDSLGFAVNPEIMDEVAFVLAMMDSNESNYVKSLFKQINLDSIIVVRYYEGLMTEFATSQYYSSQNAGYVEELDDAVESEEDVNEKDENGGLVIPSKLKSFVSIFEAEESDVSPILGREKEIETLTKVLLKSKKSNAILVGKAGVGKTAIVEDLAWRIKNGQCHEELKNKTIISLEVNDIIAGTTLRGMAEERFKLLSDYLANVENVILFIDEIHNVIGAGNSGLDDKLDFANALKPLLAREGVSVIGATTEDEYNRIFRKDTAFKRRFEKIIIREPKSNEVYPMIKEQVKKLGRFHGVAITKPVIDFIIKVSGCFNFETSNPDRTLDLIDESMVNAKLKDQKIVTTEIVMENFDANFELYNKMSKSYRYSTAYHEVGHFIVGRYGINKKKVNAISIIPTDDYLGVTIPVDDDENIIEWNYEDHLHNIAMFLAGRVAERKFTGKNSSGAASDLEKATEEARNMIVKFGLASKFSKRNAENDFYDERIMDLNKEIDEIINQGFELAERIIKEHENLLIELADELVEKGVLVQDDLEKICKKHDGKKLIVKKPSVAQKN